MNLDALERAASNVPESDVTSVIFSEGRNINAYYIYQANNDPVGLICYIDDSGIPMQSWEDDTIFNYAMVKYLKKQNVPVFRTSSDLAAYESKALKNR